MDDSICCGRLVLFFQHGELVTGFCASYSGTHVQVLHDGNQNMCLAVQRVVHSQPLAGFDAADTDSIAGRLRAVEKKQVLLAEGIDPERLWSGLGLAMPAYSPAELASILFGEAADIDHAAAVIRALQHDHVYFKFDGSNYRPHSRQQVDRAKACVAQEHAMRIECEQCAEWLHAFVNGQEPDTAARDLCIEYLRQFAVFGSGAAQYAHIRSIFKQAGIDPERKECFDILVRLGVCTPDENLLFERYGVPCSWSGEVLREADALDYVSCTTRRDASNLDACSIDDPGTRDIDDAISFEHIDGNLHIGIHITDVASLVPSGSALDLAASQRGTSLYLPEGTTPMLPSSLSENRLSLIAGEPRQVVSVFVVLDADGIVLERTLQLSTICVARRLSYRYVDDAIRSGGAFQLLYDRLMLARDARLATGASGMVVPELQVGLDRRGEVLLSVRERETPAQALVAECMILANHGAALFLKKHRVPALYRTQKPGRMSGAVGVAMSLAERMRLRHAFNRMIVDTVPRMHAGLGLDCYCSISSPMRKYLDLVVQRQLVAAIQECEPVYTSDQLRTIAAELQPVLTRASLVEKERRRYWLFKKMEPLQGKSLRAIVLSRRKKTYTVLLVDYLLELNMKPCGDCCYDPGCELRVMLADIDPFHGSISVSLSQTTGT